MNQELTNETKRLWQPLSPTPLTEGDVEEMVSNVSGFFKLLREWRDAEESEGRQEGSRDA